MTISSTVRKAGPFDGTGSQTEFPFEFKVFSSGDLYVVQYNKVTEVETVLELDSDYTVTLNADQDNDPGGTIELTSALAVNYTLTIASSLTNLQPTDLTNRGGFYPSVINDALDRACIQIQQLQEQTDRSLKVALSSTVNPTLPLPAANDLIGWNADGTALANIDPGSLASIVAYATAYADTFTGDGSTLDWVLTRNPGTIYNLDVSINGVTQVPNTDYTISGATFSTTTAAPINSEILVKYREALPNTSGDSQDFRYLPAGTGAVTTTVQAKLRETVSVKDFGAVGDGVTDDTAAIQAAINGVADGTTILFPSGTYKVTSQLLVSGRIRLTFLGERGAKLLFTDGAYIGLLFTATSGQCMIDSLMFYGTNTTAPTITLVKFTGNSAYGTIQNCQFAYASTGVLLAQSYIMRMLNNNYSGCDIAFDSTTAEGSVADLALIGETFGTCTIGSNPVVRIKYNDTRIVGCYWENQGNTKKALEILSPSQRVVVSGCTFTASGELYIDSSNNVVVSGCQFHDSYSSNRTLRVQGGANAQISGCYFSLSTLSASVVGISASGVALTVGNFFKRYLIGTSQGSGTISANLFSGCTTGVVASGSTVLSNDNQFDVCTTNVTTNGTTTAIAPSYFTGTLTGCTTSPSTTIRYEVNNGFVVLTVPQVSATSNTTACTITGLPTAIQPSTGQFAGVVLVLDNGVQSAEQCSVSGNVLTFYKNGSATGFTNSGTKGTRACTISYRLRNVS